MIVMRIKLLVILWAITINISAQSDSGVKTIFGNGKPELRYFISPSIQFGEIAGSSAILPSIGAGVIFNNQLSLGLLYKFTITENTPSGEADNSLYLHGQWFGIKGEYSIKPENVVHISFPIEVGIGEVELDIKDAFENQHPELPAGEAWFANIEPGVALEINVWKYLKLDLSVGYRIVSDITFRSLTERNLMGFTYSAGFKIGLF